MSSAGQAVGSPIAGRVLSIALLAAGVLISVGTGLLAGLGGLWCLWPWVSIIFAGMHLRTVSWLQTPADGCYCLTADLSVFGGELSYNSQSLSRA